MLHSLAAGDKWAGMARPLRIEYPGAVYRIVCRGNVNMREAIGNSKSRNIQFVLARRSF
jgi:hypothetical protein